MSHLKSVHLKNVCLKNVLSKICPSKKRRGPEKSGSAFSASWIENFEDPCSRMSLKQNQNRVKFFESFCCLQR